ncbi:type II toxin-antitoxin system Phd/YefM family antitoxin [Nocardia takedensis]
MTSLPISNVRQDLFGLVKRVNEDHDPVTVVTKSGENAVLVAESDWNSLMETMYVLQTHGGAALLASAEDAREGRTEAHALLDPDEDVEPGEATVATSADRRRSDAIVAEAADHLRALIAADRDSSGWQVHTVAPPAGASGESDTAALVLSKRAGRPDVRWLEGVFVHWEPDAPADHAGR